MWILTTAFPGETWKLTNRLIDGMILDELLQLYGPDGTRREE
jgi:hypothetical protein